MSPRNWRKTCSSSPLDYVATFGFVATLFGESLKCYRLTLDTETQPPRRYTDPQSTNMNYRLGLGR